MISLMKYKRLLIQLNVFKHNLEEMGNLRQKLPHNKKLSEQSKIMEIHDEIMAL